MEMLLTSVNRGLGLASRPQVATLMVGHLLMARLSAFRVSASRLPAEDRLNVLHRAAFKTTA